ncbi:MAG: hypothetical protein ABR973_12390 [Candidatus Acidiferrales bacterium]
MNAAKHSKAYGPCGLAVFTGFAGFGKEGGTSFSYTYAIRQGRPQRICFGRFSLFESTRPQSFWRGDWRDDENSGAKTRLENGRRLSGLFRRLSAGVVPGQKEVIYQRLR